MSVSQLMPFVIAIESGLAALVCAYNKEWNHTIYWLGSTLLVGSVAFLRE